MNRNAESPNLLGSLIEIDQMAEKIARLLTWRYEAQLKKLTSESAVVLGEVAVARIIVGLHSEQACVSDRPLLEKIIRALYYHPDKIKLPPSMHQKLTTVPSNLEWTASSALLKPGIALWDKENLALSFHVQEDEKQTLALAAKKYGYRLGSMQEVMGWSLSVIELSEEKRKKRQKLELDCVLSMTPKSTAVSHLLLS